MKIKLNKITMKKSVVTLSFFLFALIINAQPPSGKANIGDYYGLKISTENAIDISELPSLLKSKDTITIKIKAKAVSSCSSKGCWMTLHLDNDNTVFVKMKDYEFFVPITIANKNVVLEGKAFIKTTSVEELKHYAEDANKSKEEIEAIKEPKKEIRFMANGIVVVK